MAWLIGFVIAFLVLILLFLALPKRDWQELFRGLQGIVSRLRRLVSAALSPTAREGEEVKVTPGGGLPTGRQKGEQGKPAEPEGLEERKEPARTAEPEERALRGKPEGQGDTSAGWPALTAWGQALRGRFQEVAGWLRPKPAPEEEEKEEGKEEVEVIPRRVAPARDPDSYQQVTGRRAMGRMLRVSEGAELPAPVKRPPRRNPATVVVTEFRGWLLFLFVAVLLVILAVSLIPRALPAGPRSHRFTIALADLGRVDRPKEGPVADASAELLEYLRQELNRAGMTDAVDLRPVHKMPTDNAAAYTLAQANNADLLLWGQVQEGTPAHYDLTVTVVPHPDKAVPESEEYLQVMMTPPHFWLNRAGERGPNQGEVGFALTWLAHFYLGEFEQVERLPPEQFQSLALSPEVFDFHWAALQWLKGKYPQAQELYARLAGLGHTAGAGAETSFSCSPRVPGPLCAAALNNYAAVMLTREAHGDVSPATLEQAIQSLEQARVKAGMAIAWEASSLEQAQAVFAKAVQATPDALVVQYNLGRAYLVRRKWAQAVEALKVFDNPHMRDARILAALSDAYRGTGDAGSAERTARLAISINPALAEGHLALGRYWLGMDNLDEAGKELDQALTLAESEGKRRRSQEVAMSTAPQPNPYRAAYLAAWAQRSDAVLVQVHLARGNRYVLVGKKQANPDLIEYFWRLLSGAPNSFDQAQQEISTTLTLRPNWYDGLYLNGDLRLAESSYDKALAAFQEAAQQDVNAVESYWALAAVFQAQGQPEQAKEQYRLLVENHIAPAQGYFGLGEMARRAGDWEEARLQYQQAVQSDPHYAEAYLQLGSVELRLGEEDAAMSYFDQAIQNAGLQNWIRLAARVGRGGVLLEQYLRSKRSPQVGLLDKVRQEFTQGQPQPGEPREFSLQVGGVVIESALPLRQYYERQRLSGLGRVDYEQEKYNEAEGLFRQVLQSDPGNFEALYGLGRVYLARQDSGAAMEVLQRAVSAAPRSIAARYYLGEAYYAQLRSESARLLFEQVNQLCQEQQDEKQRRADDLESCEQAPVRLQQLTRESP